MKSSMSLASMLLLASVSSSSAFVSNSNSHHRLTFTTTTTTSKTELQMTNDQNESSTVTSRRAFSSTLTSLLLTGAVPVVLVGNNNQAAWAAREPRPEYLTEPTEEFKESERQRDEFRRTQLAIKKEFLKVLDRFTFESKTEQEFIDDLTDLKVLVVKTEGLPLGIKKEDVVKIIRAKKAKGNWPTDVEIAYQALTREIAYQQSPNREKDTANPL